MVRPGRDLLSGTIEVDETYVGGPEQGTRGRETESKAIVAIAVEKNGRGLGRIRLQQIGDVSTDSLLPFVQGAVERGAMVHTDGWRGYAGLAAAGYQHQVTVLSGGSDPAHEVMPRVHLVASLLKRWLGRDVNPNRVVGREGAPGDIWFDGPTPRPARPVTAP